MQIREYDLSHFLSQRTECDPEAWILYTLQRELQPYQDYIPPYPHFGFYVDTPRYREAAIATQHLEAVLLIRTGYSRALGDDRIVTQVEALFRDPWAAVGAVAAWADRRLHISAAHGSSQEIVWHIPGSISRSHCCEASSPLGDIPLQRAVKGLGYLWEGEQVRPFSRHKQEPWLRFSQILQHRPRSIQGSHILIPKLTKKHRKKWVEDAVNPESKERSIEDYDPRWDGPNPGEDIPF